MTHTPFTTLLGLFGSCAFGFPISEDIALFSAGLLVAAKACKASVIFAVAWSGIAVGDTTQFLMGRLIGPRIFERPWMRRLLTPQRRIVLEARLRRWGPFACLGARFLPGVRIPMYVIAGASGVRPLLFLALDGVAAALSVSFWLFAGAQIGGHFRYLMDPLVNHGPMLAIVATMVAVGSLTWKGLRTRFLRRRHSNSELLPYEELS